MIAGHDEVSLAFETPAGASLGLELRLDRSRFSQRLMADEFAAGRLYEPEVSLFLINVLQPGDGFVDIGAHVGYFSALAARVVGDRGWVLAFEPERGNHARVLEHVALNGLPNVEVVQAAVAADPGQGELRVNLDNDGGHALWDVGAHGFNAESRRQPTVQPVEVVTLDGFLERTRERRVRCVKIDAEGAEHLVLRGGLLTLVGQSVPFVICEINEFALARMGSSGRRLQAFMAAVGYECYLMSADEPHLEPLHDGNRPGGEWVYNVLFTTLAI